VPAAGGQGGYRWGEGRKRTLLRQEGRKAGRQEGKAGRQEGR
jgi:hypothetical protein